MRGTPASDAYGLALANQIIGLLRTDPAYILRASALFAMHRDATKNTKERQLADLGAKYNGYLLTGNYPKAESERESAEAIQYMKDPRPTGDFHSIILGRSVIHVNKNALIKTQVDRVTRDWLLGFHVEGEPWDYKGDDHVNHHEGAKLAELAEYANAKVVPVWGMKATKIGNSWYGPDAASTPLFEISKDKVENYPSTIVVDDHTAIVNDTHGISAIAWDALDADMVIGCGDHPGKMNAAYYLADRGVNVYAPFDRYIGLMIGARTKATVIGSAPIKKTPNGAEIGNQAVTIDIDELIVVSNAPRHYPLRYYDAPYRYFTLLRDYIKKPLKIADVQVTEYGKATNVVDAARQAGAKVLGHPGEKRRGTRRSSRLAKGGLTRRAVLFHTAGYREGYKLFAEFPAQTTFGDIRPVLE